MVQIASSSWTFKILLFIDIILMWVRTIMISIIVFVSTWNYYTIVFSSLLGITFGIYQKTFNDCIYYFSNEIDDFHVKYNIFRNFLFNFDNVKIKASNSSARLLEIEQAFNTEKFNRFNKFMSCIFLIVLIAEIIYYQNINLSYIIPLKLTTYCIMHVENKYYNTGNDEKINLQSIV